MSRQIRDTTTEVYALSGLGVVERWLGNTDSGDALVEKAVQIARTKGSTADLAHALIWAYATTGGVFRNCYPETELKEAHTLALETGDYWLQAHSYNGLGDLYCENRQFDEARSAYEAALQGFRRLEDRLLIAWTLEGMSRVEAGSGNPMDALLQMARALSVFDELGNVLNVGLMIARTVGILRELDPNSSCAEIAGAAATMIGRHRRHDLRQAPQIDEASRYIAGFEEAFPQEWARGQSLSRADAVNLTLEQIARLAESAETQVTSSRI
jgi:tetratricopeptide (TPR) repeat protein